MSHLSQLLESERASIAPICTFEHEPTFEVYRSDRYPFYYAANGVEIFEPESRTHEGWEEIFDASFDRAIFRHRTFSIGDVAGADRLASEFAARGYDVSKDVYMLVGALDDPPVLPDGLIVRDVAGDADWRLIRRLHNEVYNEILEIDADLDREQPLVTITREISEALGIEWFYLCDPSDGEARSSLGVFRYGEIGRLQGVNTAGQFRGRGYGEAMVRYVTHHAFERLGVSAVGLCADADGSAVRMYRRIGFEDAAIGYTAMLFP